MTAIQVHALSHRDEVQALEPLLREYLDFVCGEISRIYGIDVSANDALKDALSHVDDVLPPKGSALVVHHADQPAGMVFTRPAGLDTQEIKRLYVQPTLRGTGAGRALAKGGIAAARALGAKRIVLDSTRNLTDAARLYRSLGFVYRDAYQASDFGATELQPHMIFMEKILD